LSFTATDVHALGMLKAADSTSSSRHVHKGANVAVAEAVVNVTKNCCLFS
jgi:hypothetical protein